ncbi:MAG: hypothetical protein NWP73_04575 [Ilumatobacteraceae bacterium]|nr:hypothetical protein [Ilumatobacteraceae bacterium]MDP4702512.1 hypothetical protein [Ilumatobacteraceae bacterium]MDP5109022.1 hypothetical protein [Ilumatobacteraceae bacterium]
MKKPLAYFCRYKTSFLSAVAVLTCISLGVGVLSVSAGNSVAKKDARPEALIVGDSVMAVLGVFDAALKVLDKKHPVIYAAQPCQLLTRSGCIPETKESALERFKNARGKFSDVIVVATGYNEFSEQVFFDATKKFREEAKKQKVSIIWLTYRENGNVTEKAKRFNAILRRVAKSDPKFFLYDWNKFSRGKLSWFSGDRIHMSRGGGTNLARYLSKAIGEVINIRRSRGTTTTTSTTTTLVEETTTTSLLAG